MATFKVQATGYIGARNDMVLAWHNAKVGAFVFGGTAKQYFAEALKLAVSGIKLKAVKVKQVVISKRLDIGGIVIMMLVALCVFIVGFYIGDTLLMFSSVTKVITGCLVLLVGMMCADFSSQNTVTNDLTITNVTFK